MATDAEPEVLPQVVQFEHKVYVRKNRAVLQKSFFFESYLMAADPIPWFPMDVGYRKKRKNKAYLAPNFFMFISLIPTGRWACTTRPTSGSWSCTNA